MNVYYRINRFVTIVTIFALICGCSDESSKNSKSQEHSQSNLVMSVNGRHLTKKARNHQVGMMLKLRSLADSGMTASKQKKLQKMLRSAYPSQFVKRVVIADYAHKHEVKVSKKSVRSVRHRVLGLSPKFKKWGYKQLRTKLEPYAKAFDAYMRNEALELEVRRHIAVMNPTNISAKQAKALSQNVKKYNSTMSKTNALVFAHATNVWKQLKSGADFKKLARQYSEIPQEAKDSGEWGTLNIEQLRADEALARYAVSLKPGEFSPPIEGDNGLMILRVDSKKADTSDFALSRIYFRLPMFAKVLPPKELRKEIKKRHDMDVVGRIIAEMIDSAKIVNYNETSPNVSKEETGKVGQKETKGGSK